MAKGKSQYCTWYCTECNMAAQVTYYKKVNDEKVMKTKKRGCPRCGKHTVHKRKDTKKGN